MFLSIRKSRFWTCPATGLVWVEKPNNFQNGIYEQTYVVRFCAEKAELSDSDHPFQTYVHKRLEIRDKWLDKFIWGKSLMRN